MQLPRGSIRVVPAYYAKEKSTVKNCEISGCRHITSGGKPYCEKHIAHNSYPQEIWKRLEEREAEDLRVKKEGSIAVNLHGITTQEILRILRQNGKRTEERLEKDLQLPRSMIHNYVCALQKQGIVKITMSVRGGMLVNFLKDLEDEDEGTAY